MEIQKCIIVSAPSGAGKTTIVRHLLEEFPELSFSVSATTRPMRHYEVNGQDYHFMSVEDFKIEIQRGGFIEWEEVYPNQFYGTLKSEIEHIWSQGNKVIFDVDVVGGIHLKEFFGDRALSIFVAPPDINALRKRLEGRKTDTPEKVEMRLKKAEQEMDFSPRFDVILLNADLEKALSDAEKIVSAFLAK